MSQYEEVLFPALMMVVEAQNGWRWLEEIGVGQVTLSPPLALAPLTPLPSPHGEICSVSTTQAGRRVESEEQSTANYCYRSNVVK